MAPPGGPALAYGALAALAVIVAAVETPIELFVRSYALVVLGAVDPAHALLGDR